MSINEFNNSYLDELLEKLTNENKNIILMGDFNINLLNCKKRIQDGRVFLSFP